MISAPLTRLASGALAGIFWCLAQPACAQVILPWIDQQKADPPPGAVLAVPEERGAPAKLPALKVGDSAPAWIPGKSATDAPLPELARGRVNVLVFWAPSSEACQTSLSQFAGLAQALRSQAISFASQIVWESNPAEARAFIKDHAEWFPFPVALDTPGPSNVARTWLEAADQTAIPTAFVTDKAGRIAWIGHPLALTDTFLTNLSAGTFNLARATEAYRNALRNEPALLALWKKYQQQEENDQVPEALRTLEAIEKLAGDEGRAAVAIVKFKTLVEADDYAAAAKVAAAVSEALPKDALLQNQLAWDLATKTPGNGQTRDLALLEKIARRAYAASWERDAAIIDTLARVQFLQGKKTAAIELQEKALKLASPLLRPQLQEALDHYRQGKLPPVEE